MYNDVYRELSGFHDYRSPFAEWRDRTGLTCEGIMERSFRLQNDTHYQWFTQRELYAKTGKCVDLDAMLAHVTMNNPPSIRMETETDDSRVWTKGDVGFTGAAMCIGLLIALFCGGWPAVVAIVTVLVTLFLVITAGT